MRIVTIGPTYPFRGGVSHYTTLLCGKLSEEHDVLLVSFRRQYPDFLFPGKSNYDPSVDPILAPNVEYLIDSLDPLSWLSAVKRINAFRPDMVLFQWWVTYWAPHFFVISERLRRSKIAPEIVFICHNVFEHENNLLKKMLTKAVFSRVDRFITHCHQETSRLKLLLGQKANVQTAFHPTYKDFCSLKVTKEAARMKLNLSGNVLLFFGFVRKYKGLDLLLEALSHVTKKKSVTLLVVGEFWEHKAPYLKAIEKLGLNGCVVIVDAYVPNELAGLYFAAADLVVQPYIRASGSGVAQMAYGYDRPVIATSVGSLSEVINDKVNGRIVLPEDAYGLAEAILDSLEPSNLKTLTKNSAKTKEKFSWERLVHIIVTP